MKLIKKLMAALSVLCLVGMLAACGGGAGGGENGGGGSGSSYTIVYGSDTLGFVDDEDFDEFSVFFEERQDYTISGKTISLTTDGYTKFTVIDTMMGAFEDQTSIDPSTCYTVVYDEDGNGITEDDIVMMIPSNILPGFTQMLGLTTPNDYSVDEANKTITLTATGYQKGGTFYLMLMGSEE